MTSIFPQWVQDLNTGLSFIGFCITLDVMVEVRYIKNSFLRRARLPEVTKDLSDLASELNKSISHQWPEQRKQAKSQIKIAASLLKSAEKMLPKDEREDIKKKLLKLENAANTSGDAKISWDDYWELYSDICSVVTTMEQLSKNIKWE